VRRGAKWRIVRVKDVARSSWGTGLQHCQPVEWAKPAHRYPVYQLPVSSAVQTAAGVRKLMAEIEEALPTRHGLRDNRGSDARRHRGHEGNHRDPVIAIVMVILVVFLFLQDGRRYAD